VQGQLKGNDAEER
jgi:hypothetical protein